MVHFIHRADDNSRTKLSTGHTSLIDLHSPAELERLLSPTTTFSHGTGSGRTGALALAHDVLRYSVNTSQRGFLDKLYAAPSPVGIAAETLLAALNTNVHVYGVSPALTVVEKRTGRALAAIFGFTGPRAGAISQPGGSAANQTSLAVARNCLFPETKQDGLGGRRFVLFTSAHGHYSVEKAAQMAGLGARAVKSVPVDPQGRMRAAALEEAIQLALRNGETPFYVNATAGTTVFGAVDPLNDIANICSRHRLWMHVDASWGGGMMFSEKQRHKLAAINRADSVSFCSHKMLGVPLTCSFLISKDLRDLHRAMTLPAGYLFHNDADHDAAQEADDAPDNYWDLADLTPQCGRRGDSLKLAMAWSYHGTAELGAYVDNGFDAAAYLAHQVEAHPRLKLVSENPPPCLQISFYFDPVEHDQSRVATQVNSRITEEIAWGLVPRGFMVDYAPGESGKFLRVVVNGRTTHETVDELVAAVVEVGAALES